MKKTIIIILIIIAVLAGGGYIAVTFISSNHEKQIENITIEDIDLSEIEDGTYKGSHDVFPVSVEVEVNVKEHKITDIELIKHIHGQGADAEVIPEKVVGAQSLNIDAVTGATSSSRVILKAIEKALTGRRE